MEDDQHEDKTTDRQLLLPSKFKDSFLPKYFPKLISPPQLDMGKRTREGDAVYAPVGLCYSCSTSGKFRSLDTNSSVSGEVHFPDWRMQVFEVNFGILFFIRKYFICKIFQVRRGKFGPEWECGDMISIGLWVGILVTLGFALICAWGFSMLASINVSFLTIRLLQSGPRLSCSHTRIPRFFGSFMP